MNRKFKRALSSVLAMVMCFGAAIQSGAVQSDPGYINVADRAAAFYQGGDTEFVKISHPEKPTSTATTNVADGILDYLGNGRMGVPGVDPGAEGQGDRGQSYSWASVGYGDWMYVATQFNPMMSTVGLMDSGLGHDYDPEQMEAIINAMYRGEFFVKEEDGGNPGSTLCKINVKTGEVKLLMSKATTRTNANFRNAVEFNGKLYFCGAVNGVPSIYEIDPEQGDKITCVFQDETMKRPDAWPEALKKQISPTIRGMSVYNGCLVINCVGLDENPYIAIAKDPTKGFSKIAFAWEDVENQIPGELLGYPACHFDDVIYGGSIWDITEFNGDLYVAICTGTPENSPDGGRTMQSFAIMRGEYKGDPEKRESWTWTPVVGDKEDGAKYTFGIDPERTRGSACTMMVFNDHLYIGEYNDTEIALINLMFNLDAQFLADNLEQSVSLYRMDKDENVELVMGDPTEMFPESLSGMKSGFGQRTNQYIWRMETFEDKLYMGTLDEGSLLYPVGQITTGDIFKMNGEQWQRQMKYLKELIDKLQESKEEEQKPAALSQLSAAYDRYESGAVLMDNSIDSVSDLTMAMLDLSQRMDQPEDWDIQQMLDAKISFNELYQEMYNFYFRDEVQAALPFFVKETYGQVLNKEMLGKVASLARCAYYLKDTERGFDMMATEDGVNFDCITRTGMGDNHNHGLRVFAVNESAENPWLCLGTANPFYGTQIWRMESDDMVFPRAFPFIDVNENDWFYNGVRFTWERNLFSGITPNQFGPKIEMTRAMLVQVLYGMEGKPAVSGEVSFPDVAEDAWYTDAVRWAVSEGVVSGYDNGNFGPEDVVTREQLAVILYALADRPAAEQELTFADADKVSDWAVDAVRWAVENGIMTGVGGNLIAPAATATRAEGAVMLMQYIKLAK